MSSFLYDHSLVTKIDTHPESGNEVKITEKVPKNLPSLEDESWEDPMFLLKTLGLQVGPKVRYTTKKNTEVRDLFFVGVQGDPNPRGGRYGWKKIGTLFSGMRQDSDTNKMKRWISLQLVGEEQQQAQPTATTTQPTPTTDESAEEATAEVESA